MVLRVCLIMVCAWTGLTLSGTQTHAQTSDTTLSATQRLTEALGDLARDDPARAYASVGALGSLGENIITWRRLFARQGDFANYATFLDENPDWPEALKIRARGEKKITDDTPIAQILDYFSEVAPDTGWGALHMARALRTAGEAAQADELLIETWKTFGLTEREFDRFIADHAALVKPHHARRGTMLMFRDRFTDADSLVEVMDDADANLLRAKLALRRNADVADALADLTPEQLREPSLLYARFASAAGRNKREEAMQTMLANSTSVDTLGVPFRWSGHRRALARYEMRNGDPQRAYDIAANHHMTDGYNRNDLEWLAGYLALQRLDDPVLALRHFQEFDRAAETPISRGRAGYWLGRTHEVLQNPVVAQTAYADAAQHQTSFYGLLAAEKAGVPIDPTLAGVETFPDYRTAAWIQTDLSKAGILLIGAGEQYHATLFFLHLSQNMSRTDLGQLSQMLTDLRAPYVATLVGKAAATRGIVIPQMYFPLHPLAKTEMSIDPALALAIARRESEFNPRVASPVGAQGLMQLMPATAREVAGNLGLPYSKSRLTSDPNYNAILGITYLEELQDRLGNTPAMIAAGYNAGPARPQNWAEEYGDPRTGGLDVVDYIEMIPFRETRNYVMRVTESLPVYRARLTGTAVEPEFTKLLIGALPDVLSRPSVATPAPTSDVTLEFAAPQTTQVGIRPRARPGTTGPIAADQIPGQTTNLETVLTPEAEAVPETPTRATETAAPQITPPQTAPLTSVRPQPRPRLQWSEIIVRRGTQISREPTSPTRISGPSGPSAAGN